MQIEKKDSNYRRWKAEEEVLTNLADLRELNLQPKAILFVLHNPELQV